MTARRAQALRHGAGAALWQRALGDLAPAADGAGARDSLVCAVAMALGDLLVRRGDDAVAAAALLVTLDPRWAGWICGTAHASRPLRVVAAAGYLFFRASSSLCSCLGVRAPSR